MVKNEQYLPKIKSDVHNQDNQVVLISRSSYYPDHNKDYFLSLSCD